MNVIAHGTWYFARSFILARDAINIEPVHGLESRALSIYGEGCWRWRFLAADSANLHERFARGGRLSKGGKLPAIYRVKREHRFIEDPSCSKRGKAGSAFSRIDPPLEFFPLSFSLSFFFISFYTRKVFEERGEKKRMIGGTRFGVKNRKTRMGEKSRFIRSTLTF